MYCSISDIQLPNGEITQDKLAELTTYKGETPVQVREDRVNSLIYDSTQFINGYLRGIYPIPADGEPFGDGDGIINNICAKLTIHELYKRKLAAAIPELYKNYRNEAISQLRDIQKRLIILDIGTEEITVTKHRTVSNLKPILTDDSISKGFSL